MDELTVLQATGDYGKYRLDLVSFEFGLEITGFCGHLAASSIGLFC